MLSYILLASPILLIIIIGTLIRVRGNPETAGRRYFLFLIWTTVGSLAIILVRWMFPLPILGYVMVLFPIIPGLVVLTLLHWREWKSLHKQARISILSAVIILLVATIVQFVILSLKDDRRQLEPVFFGMALLFVSACMFIAWKWGNRYPFLLAGTAILYLTLFNVTEMGSLSLPSETMPGWWNALGALAYLVVPDITIPTMAMLTANVLNILPIFGESRSASWRSIIGRLILLLILLGSLLYTYWWLWLWDGVDDGIRWFFMAKVSGIAAMSAGMVIAMTASGWQRWAGLVFAILVMGTLYLLGNTTFGVGEGVTNYTVTEKRAAQIQKAIENYHAKTGWYPLHLKELVPDELLRIPLPMIIPEQDWCYQGGSNFYRLGAVYREHWSSPYLNIRVYASAGNIPEAGWDCDEELVESRSRYGMGFGPEPTPVPLPTSVTSIQKVVVAPLLQAGSFSVGSWSPDGSYLVFGLTEYFMDEVEHVTIDLRFLDAKTRNICQPGQSQWTVKQSNGLRDHAAWLPDGRFLYVTGAGEMLAFTPCSDSVEDLASRYPARFTNVMSSGEQGGRVLLKDEESYWLLNGNSLEVRKIADLSTEAYWSWYDWSPGGERLAISQMSGPEEADEAFLYIVDWASGEVEQSLPLEGASDAAPPIVEWLTRDELLLQGDTLTVMDFRSEPTATTDVLKDVFLLDIAYPLDVWGMDTVSSKDGEAYYLGVQVNHPRNKDAYVYSSKTGQVEVFHHDVSTVIFFPDGQWMRLFKWEEGSEDRDEYELVWMDRSHVKTRLKVEGHVPRAHAQIFPRYLPDSSQLVFYSSQGISLVSIPAGRTTGFWELASNADYFDVIPSPNGEALVIASGGDGLYYIPVPGK